MARKYSRTSLLPKGIPIGQKILLLCILTGLVSSILTVGAFLWALRSQTFERYQNNAGVIADLLAENLAACLDFEDRDFANSVLQSSKASPDLIDAVLLDQNGEIFAVYERAHRFTEREFKPLEQGDFLTAEGYYVSREIYGPEGERLGNISIRVSLNPCLSRFGKSELF